LIGNTDLGATVMITKEVNRLGLGCNEASWTIAWVMECYEKGVFSKDDLDGLDLSWGNVESARALLTKIGTREGIGELLADGVMRPPKRSAARPPTGPSTPTRVAAPATTITAEPGGTNCSIPASPTPPPWSRPGRGFIPSWWIRTNPPTPSPRKRTPP
jgi:hypothetical protein